MGVMTIWRPTMSIYCFVLDFEIYAFILVDIYGLYDFCLSNWRNHWIWYLGGYLVYADCCYVWDKQQVA